MEKEKILEDNSGKVNVLWLVDHLGYNGAMHGAGMYFLNTIPALDSRKFNVLLCVLRKEDNLTKLFKDKGINIFHLGRGKFDPMTLFDILKIIMDEKIHVIHAHGYGSSNFGRLMKIFRKISIIVHAHDDDRNYPFHQKLADRLLCQFIDRAIAVSKSVKDSCVIKRKMREDNVFIMHNGIPLKDFVTPEEGRINDERDRLGVPPGCKVIGTVAKLREEKGIIYLLQSAVKVLSIFSDTCFLIAGDGLLREELEKHSKRLGIDSKVIFAGFCHNIPVILSIMDIVVIPSLTEGSPLALLEAMAMEKPIVATNVGGIKEILIDGETGLLVPSKNPEALAEKIFFLFNNPNQAIYLGRKAKEESKMYDITTHVEILENHYHELMGALPGKGEYV